MNIKKTLLLSLLITSLSSSVISARMDLLDAAQANNIEELKILIKSNADVNTKGHGNETALIVAAAWGRIESVKILLQANADVNMQDTDGKTALMYAVSNHNPVTIDLLIKAKANVNIQDANGQTALMIATSSSSIDIECIKLLLNANAQVNLRDISGRTALHDYLPEYLQENPRRAAIVKLLRGKDAKTCIELDYPQTYIPKAA